MQEYLNQLDPELIYEKTTFENDTMFIYCEKKKKTGPYVNSKKVRTIKDINYGKYKVILKITTRKYFPWKDNDNYSSDQLDFLNYSKLRTQRLDDFCLEVLKNQSIVATERLLKATSGTISDSTIARLLLKKNRNKLL